MQKELNELYNYLRENNSAYAISVSNLYSFASNSMSVNQLAMSVADDMGALSTVGDESLTYGSDLEVRMGPGTVYKMTKIDMLSNGYVLCAAPHMASIPAGLRGYDIVSLSSNMQGRNPAEKVKSYLLQNRNNQSFGGIVDTLNDFFGGTESKTMSTETISSNTMYNKLYAMPSDTQCIVLDRFDVGAVQWDDVTEFASEVIGVAASLSLVFLSGGAVIPIRIAKLISNAAMAHQIIGDVVKGQLAEALLGSLCLWLGIKNNKALLSFYTKYVKSSGRVLGPARQRVLLHAPQSFYFLIKSLIDTMTWSVEGVAEIVDEKIGSIYTSIFGDSTISEQEIAKRLEQEEYGQALSVLHDAGGIQGFSQILSSGFQQLVNEFEAFLPEQQTA
jgi:hypothetical protein